MLNGFERVKTSRWVWPTPSAPSVVLNAGRSSWGELRLDTDGATAVTGTLSVPASEGTSSVVVTAPPATGANRSATVHGWSGSRI